MVWSARQYLTFEDERTRPARDLLAAVPTAAAGAVIDLGCGPGNSTELLAARFPGADVRGIDSSPDMIAAARARLPAHKFDVLGIESWLRNPADSQAFDVIFANAVMQWVPQHDKVFCAIAARLVRGGTFAVQMPDNLGEPSHRLMSEVAAEGPWTERLAAAGNARTSVQSAHEYHRMLRAAGCRVEVWRTTYYHALGGASAVVEWFKGSGLRPFLEPLAAEERREFLARYESAVAAAYPPMPDGTVLLPFPRIFMVAAA